MEALYTAEQVRALEAAARSSTLELMDQAGRALAHLALSLRSPEGRVLVFCGPGNNGGDGLVAARVLRHKGHRVEVVLVADAARLPPDAAQNHLALLSAGVVPVAPDSVSSAQPGPGDVVVDALFGTGLDRAPTGALAGAIECIQAGRARGAKVVSADLPSGIAGDTGTIHAPSVQADATAVFGVLKPAHALEPAASACGRLVRVPLPLDVPATAPVMALLAESDVRALLPVPAGIAHKGTFGHVLVVAGSPGRTGAAALSAKGALRAGAGKVTVAATRGELDAILGFAPEVMGHALPADAEELGPQALEPLLSAAEGKDAVLLGPGIARGAGTRELLARLLPSLSIPLVLDADGLNALAGDVSILRDAGGPVVLTPHPGEMSRLVRRTTTEVQADRIGTARDLAAASGAFVVLKGARTVIAAPDGTVRVCASGNPGLGTAGTGDVLAGVLAALLGQGIALLDAVCCGVWAHGLAGDLMVAERGMRGLNASDLFDGLGRVWARWER